LPVLCDPRRWSDTRSRRRRAIRRSPTTQDKIPYRDVWDQTDDGAVAQECRNSAGLSARTGRNRA